PPPAEASAPAPPAPKTTDLRRRLILDRLGGMEAFNELLRPDDLDGPLLAGNALEAFAQGSELRAVLLAQAALGADPGNGARRRLLKAVSEETGIAADPEGTLPLRALVQHELSRSEAAFFEGRYGPAVQACRRALLLDPDDAMAWLRLGSSYYALGDESRARAAWDRARRLKADDPALSRFLAERGWEQ
ncbi:MAG: tetratricopeptide repeat protein, partial [Elusimicrobia bacterium]|nr:tetratricopeptide repeat protein [Elusimicrobiota bacterium]